MIKNIKQKLEKIYNTFDGAHNMDHINEVVKNANKINEILGYMYPEYVVTLTALYHDIGLQYGREDHEKHSARILKEDLDGMFDDYTLEIMSKACEEHRASYKGQFTSMLSKIINDADTMYTKESLILRSYKYSKKVKNTNNVYNEVYNHLNEKYGVNGYHKFRLNICKNLPVIKEAREMLENEEIFREEYMKLTKNETL